MTFTPGQIEEAVSYIQKECPDLWKLMEASKGEYPIHTEGLKTFLVDLFFKIKAVKFDLRPEEFIVGIEYKDKEKVTKGEEEINIRMQNPRRILPADPFAQQVLLSLLNQMKGG